MRRFVVLAILVMAIVTVVYAQAPGPGTRRGDGPSGAMLQMLRGGSEIGVSIRDVARDDVSKMKLPTEAGAVIEDVRRGTPAETAGLRAGDVIVEFDGEKVRSSAQFTRLVRETPAGRRVKTTFIRSGRRMDVDIAPAESEGMRIPFNADEVRQSIERTLPFPMRRSVLGVTTQEMTPELATYFGAKDGVLVTSIVKDSPADRAGMKVGDVITEVAGKPIGNGRDLVREMQTQQGTVALKVVRDKKELMLNVALDRASDRPQQVRGI